MFRGGAQAARGSSDRGRRALQAGADLASVARSAGLAALAGALWLALAMAAFRALFAHARRGSAALT
ncbi:hypothetical protein [Streptomyces zhihengii]|uniref:hypothetical protein n=1 Tax=Streptomyces zhihengii TaxID=1818004 RepID=UPI0033B92E30